MTHLAPWQRNMVALACGITLKASGKMKWTANVDVHGVKPQDSTIFGIFPIEADSEIDAARLAAKSAAEALFGKEGEAGFINQTDLSHVYMATVGVYFGGGLSRGRSAQILIREYHGAQ
jgi:hypothetical protein